MFVKNPQGEDFVVIVPKRLERPDQELHGSSGPVIKNSNCPFCSGSENLNETIDQIEKDNSGDWLVRTIQNKFPITEHHEVIIHSPDHEKDIDSLSIEQVNLIVQTYQKRFKVHQKKGRVVIFNNHGVHAGSSLKHPHSQLVVIPNEIPDKQLQTQAVNNIIMENNDLVVFCPDYSEWPYEVWITLNKTISTRTFGDLNEDELKDFAQVLQKVTQMVIKKFESHESLHKHKDDKEVPYNFYISSGDNWYLRLIPRLVHPAGFELATKMNVNVVDPKRAAEEYKKINF